MNHMKTLIYWILIGLIATACTPQNFDVTEEEANPYEPVRVTLDQGKLRYNLQGRQFNYQNGFGTFDGKNKFYVIASDSIFCEPNGGYRTKAQQDTGFVVSFIDDGISITIPQAVLRRRINGEIVGLYSFSLVRNCTTNPGTVTLTRKDSTGIAGSYVGEFFELIPGQDPNACSAWKSVGVLRAEFDVPLKTCR